MKKPQRLLTCIVAIVLAITLALVACVDKPLPIELTELVLPELADNQMAVIVRNDDNDYTCYVVTLGIGGTNAKTVEGVLKYLEESDLVVEWVDGDYGKYINSIGRAIPTKMNEYVEVFTSVNADKGTWADVTTYVIGEVEIVSSAVGVTEMSVQAGAIIYFQISTY